MALDSALVSICAGSSWAVLQVRLDHMTWQIVDDEIVAGVAVVDEVVGVTLVDAVDEDDEDDDVAGWLISLAIPPKLHALGPCD